MTDFLSYIKTDYTQICSNIYLFDSINKEDFHNIYQIYYDAIQQRNSNINKSIIMFNDCINLIESKIENELEQKNNISKIDCF